MDNSRDIFERYYSGAQQRTVRIRLKTGKYIEGRFVGFFRGDIHKNEPYIFRWHFLEKSNPVFDYDKTIDPDQGIFIEHADIAHVEFC